MNQTAIFQALASEVRLRALMLIAHEKEVCVCELVHALGAEQSKISRHLSAMKNAGLLTAHRKAQWVYYALNHNQEAWQQQIITAAIAGASNDPQIMKDRKRLKNMKKRPETC